MKKTFEDNRARLGAKEREDAWARIAGQTVRTDGTGDDAERSAETRPRGRIRWTLWGPMAIGAAASVVLVVSLWDQRPTNEQLHEAAGRPSVASEMQDAAGGLDDDDVVTLQDRQSPAPPNALQEKESGELRSAPTVAADPAEDESRRSERPGEEPAAARAVEAEPERLESSAGSSAAPDLARADEAGAPDAELGTDDRGLTANSGGRTEAAPEAPPTSSSEAPSTSSSEAASESPSESASDVPPEASRETLGEATREVKDFAGAANPATPDSLEQLLVMLDARPGEIVGRVLDQEGDPVPYANVVVAGTQWGAMTIDDGTFRIANVPDGTYELRALIIGYTQESVSNVVVGEEPVALAFQVEETTLGSLNEVEITASRERMEPRSTTTNRDIGSGDIAASTLADRPVSEIEESMDAKSGAILKEGDLHFRGGRAGEVDVAIGEPRAAGEEPVANETWGEVKSLSDRASDRRSGEAGNTRSHAFDPGRQTDDEDGLDPRPSAAPYDLVYYQDYGSNPLVFTDRDRLSTFAVDVDNGSYTIGRRYVTDGYLPEPASVRVEEFVNFFEPGYAEFDDTDFRIYADGAPSPFRDGFQLLRIGLQARTVDESLRPSARLTFVVDVSGSMARENRLGLVRRSLEMLVDRLRDDDEVAIVAYGSSARVVLHPTPARDRERIQWGIGELVSGGSTNAEDGLRLGYDMARRMYRERGINRVLLCSDGVANVGRTGPEGILRTVRTESDQGIYLTTIGYGMGNYNDVLMEQLANQGDGAYYYVDRYEEAERVLVRELTGTLLTVARDAKVQVEFDRNAVEAYRLVGFENRDVADRDFRNDAIDAGEIGSGHSVVALYEVKLRDRIEPGSGRKGLATVRLRYAVPDQTSDRDPEVREISRQVTEGDFTSNFERAPWRFRLAGVVAQYAEILRNSYWAQDDLIAELVPYAADLAFYLREDDEIVEFARIVEKAAELQSTMTAQELEARWPRLEARAPDYPDPREWER